MKIIRYREAYEEVEVPTDCIPCSYCNGKGAKSKYDEGWNSLVHEPSLAAKVECIKCHGEGYVKKIYEDT